MTEIQAETKRGVLLDGVLFNETKNPDTVMIAITGIHGNFYSNPFYYNFADTLNNANIDFIYAQNYIPRIVFTAFSNSSMISEALFLSSPTAVR